MHCAPGGMRWDWQVVNGTSDTVGYLGLCPVTRVRQVSPWKAMLYTAHNPAEGGLKVDGVTVRGMAGFIQHTMRIPE